MPSPVLIVSQDADFTSVLAEQLKLQLGLESQIAKDGKEAKSSVNAAGLVVTTQPETEGFSCPVISIAPPVKLAPLLADIGRRLQKQPEEIKLGRGYLLRLRQKKLKAGTGEIDLTDKEAQLLQSLASAGKAGVAKEQLLKDVWGIEAVLDTHTLETHIYRLRGKFRELGDEDMITAAEGGYALATK